MRTIDTLVLIIADQDGGKSNQIRSIFTEPELCDRYSGYPKENNIARRYDVHPDIELYVRLSSWHEKGKDYEVVRGDIAGAATGGRKRLKVIAPAQITPTDNLPFGAEDLFIKLCTDFEVRRGFAVWLSPRADGDQAFRIGSKLARFMGSRRHLSALSIDARAGHPSGQPDSGSINARFLCDLLFRL